MTNLKKIITFSFFIVATSLVLAPFVLAAKKKSNPPSSQFMI